MAAWKNMIFFLQMFQPNVAKFIWNQSCRIKHRFWDFLFDNMYNMYTHFFQSDLHIQEISLWILGVYECPPCYSCQCHSDSASVLSYFTLQRYIYLCLLLVLHSTDPEKGPPSAANVRLRRPWKQKGQHIYLVIPCKVEALDLKMFYKLLQTT